METTYFGPDYNVKVILTRWNGSLYFPGSTDHPIEIDVLVHRKLSFCYIDAGLFLQLQGGGMRRSGGYGD